MYVRFSSVSWESFHGSLMCSGFLSAVWRRKYMFSKEVLGPISEQMCVASPMKYSTILDMDRRIRDFCTRYPRPVRVSQSTGGRDISGMMQAMMISAFAEIGARSNL